MGSHWIDYFDALRAIRRPTITPAGLPGPFVVTQALGVLAIAMLVVAVAVGGERAILWAFSALVLGLVGVVGLIFWLLGLRTRRG